MWLTCGQAVLTVTNRQDYMYNTRTKHSILLQICSVMTWIFKPYMCGCNIGGSDNQIHVLKFVAEKRLTSPLNSQSFSLEIVPSSVGLCHEFYLKFLHTIYWRAPRPHMRWKTSSPCTEFKSWEGNGLLPVQEFSNLLSPVISSTGVYTSKD